MVKCANCSAPIKEDLEQCGFCGSITALGIAAKASRDKQAQAASQAAQQRSAIDAQAAKLRAQGEIDQSGKWALISSIVGTVVCCLFPVGPVMGIVFGLRARRLAAQHGLHGASLGTAGLSIGILGVALAVFVWVGAGVMSVLENRHKSELRARLGSSETLDLNTACILTELELMETRYEGFSALTDFECTTTGDLAVNGREAVLTDTHFDNSGTRKAVVSCLQLKSKWTVKQLRADEDCSDVKPGAKAKH